MELPLEVFSVAQLNLVGGSTAAALRQAQTLEVSGLKYYEYKCIFVIPLAKHVRDRSNF